MVGARGHLTPVLRGHCEILAQMEHRSIGAPRVATVADAAAVAALLDAFNKEYHAPTPGPAVLAGRLRRLLAGTDVIALLAGDPAVAVAVLTLRPSVWYEGPVAILDELYVAAPHRGRGIGSALLAAVEAITRQRRGQLLEIRVDGADVDARRFYERHGYTTIDPEQDQPSFYYYRELSDQEGWRFLKFRVTLRSPDPQRCAVSHTMSSDFSLIFVSLSWKVSGVGALDAQGGGV
jgi:GNAT superfamily N-acetyltransferase